MLDFRVETFLCVCKYRSYTKAAEKLNLTQPGVSQHIRYIEKYYQTKLFTYANKTLLLTPFGEKLRSAMISAKHDNQHLKNSFREMTSEKKHLKFGATLTVGEFAIPQKLSGFMNENPQIQVELTIANTCELLSLLNEGTIDFAVIEGYFPKSEYDYRLVSDEEYVGVCGGAYPLDEIHRFADLFAHRILVREKGSGTKEVLVNYLYEHGYSLNDFSNISVINNIHTIKQLLENNCGISFLYKTAVDRELRAGTLKQISINGFHVTHEFNFVWRKNSIFKNEYISVYRELMK